MYAGVGIEQQWLSAAAAGSVRFLLNFSPSSSSSSVSSSYAWARQSGLAVKVEKGLGSRKSPLRAVCDFGKSIVNRGGMLIPENVRRHSQQARWCAEAFPTRAGHGMLRPLSSLPIRAPRVTASSTALTEGIHTEEIVEGAWKDFMLNGSRTTSIAHKVWQGVVRPGDTVIDATCGNGLDTLMLAKLVLQDGTAGYVIGLDLQQSALENTSALLSRELKPSQRDKVSLLQLCHSELNKVVDESSVRLVAFNLGYQPGGNKSFTTQADTTVKALGAAVKVTERQGLISIMSYVGHPGGREEYDAVREFVAGLPDQEWVCSHLDIYGLGSEGYSKICPAQMAEEVPTSLWQQFCRLELESRAAGAGTKWVFDTDLHQIVREFRELLSEDKHEVLV